MKYRILVLSIIIAMLSSIIPLVTPAPVVADSKVFGASDDAYISGFEGKEDTNYGNAVNVATGVWFGYPSTWRSVLKFSVDWGTDIPTDATITVATLELYYEGYESDNPVGLTVYADRLLRTDFLEGEVTWNDYKTGSSWTTAGAGSSSSDYTTTGRASDTVPSSSDWMEWDVLTQVQWAQTNDKPVAVRIAVQGEPEGYVPQWFSSEYGSSSYRPKLTITYTYTAVPTVKTDACTDISGTSMTANGEVTYADELDIIRRGFTYMEGEGGDPADVIELLNPSFESGAPPSSWTAYSVTPARESSIVKMGTYSAKLTNNGAWSWYYSVLADPASYQGTTITLGMWCRASSANDKNQRLIIGDDVGGWAYSYGSTIAKDDTWYWATLSRSIRSGATEIRVGIQVNDTGTSDTNDITYIDCAVLMHDDEILAVYEDDAFGEEKFDLEIFGLDSATSYRVRAFAQSDAGIGYGSSVTGTTLDEPAITTVAASNVASTSARLNSALSDDGGGDCTIKFGWGLSSETDIEDYDSYETLPGTYNTGQYPYLDVSGLLPDYTYYFRVSATNALGTDTGDELTFVTTVSISAPSNFIGYPESTSISLSWSRGAGSTNTLVRYNMAAYPTTITAGIYAYQGPSTTYTLEGLLSGTTYYISAWGESGGNYSATYTTLLMTTSASAGITTPDIDVPAQPSRWFAAPDYTSMAGLGIIYDGYNSALDFGHVPRETGWFLNAVFLSALFGLLSYLKFGKKFMIGVIVLTVCLAIGYFLKLIPWWLPLTALILVIVWPMTHKQVNEG